VKVYVRTITEQKYKMHQISHVMLSANKMVIFCLSHAKKQHLGCRWSVLLKFHCFNAYVVVVADPNSERNQKMSA